MVVEIYAGPTCQYPNISSLGVRGGVEYHIRGVFLESFPHEVEYHMRIPHEGCFSPKFSSQLISRELFARV